MSRILVIGAGGVGSVAVHKMAMNADIFSHITLASRTVAKDITDTQALLRSRARAAEPATVHVPGETPEARAPSSGI